MNGPKWRQPTGRGYYRPATDQVIPGVTSLVGALDSDAGGLIGWATNTTADAAITHRDAWASMGTREEAAALIKAEARAAQRVKRDIGSVVHGAIEAALGADLRGEKRPDFHPALVPYLDALELFMADTGWEVEATELTVINTKWDYAGTLDAIGRVPPGPPVIVDWKSGSVRPTTGPAQIDLYRAADKILNDDGTESMTPWAGRLDVQAWIVQLSPRAYTVHEIAPLDHKELTEMIVALNRVRALVESLPATMTERPTPAKLEGAAVHGF